jgi:cellobionic acid phosphorylase
VYNHASIFYIYSLFNQGFVDQAFDLIMKMIPDHEDVEVRNQLPVFIPNYYRGAYFQQPSVAGRSSQLFNTGTVSWLYLVIVEQLCGLKGQAGKLVISPNLPKCLDTISGVRFFCGATFNFIMLKTAAVSEQVVTVNNILLAGNVIEHINKGETYQISVQLPLNHTNSDKFNGN